jgi:hypothetical protein
MVATEQDLSGRFEMRGISLDPLRRRVDLAEPLLAWPAVEDRQRVHRPVRLHHHLAR